MIIYNSRVAIELPDEYYETNDVVWMCNCSDRALKQYGIYKGEDAEE